jgi:acetyltransferase-like isoleucine patch superfamily enzyme
MYQRRGPNEIGSLSHAWKGFLGNIASLLFYPPVVIALMHKIRGVKIKNIRKLYITFNVMIDNVYPELVTIGEDVWLTRNVTILTHFNPSESLRDFIGDIVCKEVIIEDGVFIGIGSIILPGVKIGKNSVVGAGSVVTKDVPPYTIVAGNPATVIKELMPLDRGQELTRSCGGP